MYKNFILLNNIEDCENLWIRRPKKINYLSGSLDLLNTIHEANWIYILNEKRFAKNRYGDNNDFKINDDIMKEYFPEFANFDHLIKNEINKIKIKNILLI